MHRSSRFIFLLSSLVIFTDHVSFAAESASATAQAQAQPLEQRILIERELKGGETHAYTIRLEAGQFLQAAANQRGVDVVVRLFAPTTLRKEYDGLFFIDAATRAHPNFSVKDIATAQ